jgi:hypothetical protein
MVVDFPVPPRYGRTSIPQEAYRWVSRGKFKNCSPISKSAIQDEGSNISVKVSTEGRGNDGAHKALFKPDLDASYTKRISSIPLGTAKKDVRLVTIPRLM